MRGTVGFPTSSGDHVEEGGLEGITDTGGGPALSLSVPQACNASVLQVCETVPEPRVRHGLCNLVGSHEMLGNMKIISDLCSP